MGTSDLVDAIHSSLSPQMAERGFGPGGPGWSPDGGASFLYCIGAQEFAGHPELDLVAVHDSGHSRLFGACCIAWFDPATGVSEIEPLGVAPEHRRRGLAVALCHEVAKLTADRGGTHVFINAQPQPGYVASTAAYISAGFELIERATTYATRNRKEATSGPTHCAGPGADGRW